MNSLFENCSYNSTEYNVYNATIFYGIASVQITEVSIGTIMNLYVIVTFYRFRHPRMKMQIQNILLLNQALADLFNSSIFGVSNLVNVVLLMNNNNVFAKSKFPYIIFTITHFSSVFLFAAIALERFLSIYRPVWHRACLRRKHTVVVAVMVWCIAILIGLCEIMIHFYSRDHIYTYYNVTNISLIVLVAFVTLLSTATLVKALCTIKSPNSKSRRLSESKGLNRSTTNNTIKFYLKKQFRLARILFLMFLAFAVVVIPLTIFIHIGKIGLLWGEIMNCLLMLTSIFNPSLTIYVKKDFRLKRRSTNRRSYWGDTTDMNPLRPAN